MNNENRRSDIPEDLRTQIRRPAVQSTTAREDVEGIRRPVQRPVASPTPRQSGAQSVARPASRPASQSVHSHQNVVSAAAGASRPRPAAQSRAAQSAPVQPRRVVKEQNEAAKRRSSSNASNLANTRSIDRERIRKTRANEAAKRRKTYNEPDNSSYDGGSGAVMSLIKAILYIVIVVAVSGLLSYYIIVFANDMYAFVKSSEEVEVSIPEYATVEEIAEILGDAGVVDYPDLLVIYAKLKKIDKTYEFIAGDYTVNGMMNYDELFYAFVEQKSYEVVRITIPEGYTVDEMITLFTENGIGTREGFIDVINNYDFDFEFVKALDEMDLEGRTYRLEGYLYPDTYEFYKSSSEATVIYRLLKRYDVIFSDDFYARAEALGYTVDEIMTLASMIEKEARYAQDYETVSSVFHNRLKSASFPRLESDATIMYAIQVRDGERKGALTGEDLSYDTPYNTYLYSGLPPGPIANPGYEAITCALWPASTKYYYFVSDNYGNTYFSRTNAEHEQAKAKVAKINAGS